MSIDREVQGWSSNVFKHLKVRKRTTIQQRGLRRKRQIFRRKTTKIQVEKICCLSGRLRRIQIKHGPFDLAPWRSLGP